MKKYFGTLIEGTSYTRLQTCKYGYYKAKLIDEKISTLQAEVDDLKKAKYELFDMLETVHLGRFTHVELFVLLEKHRSK